MTDIIRVVGAIEDKNIKEGVKKDGSKWVRYSFIVGGKTFASFDEKLNSFNVGDMVSIAYIKEGIYNTLKEMVIADASAKATASPISHDVQKLIVRQTANERAVQLFSALAEYDKKALTELLEANKTGILGLIDIFAKHFENLVWRE